MAPPSATTTRRRGKPPSASSTPSPATSGGGGSGGGGGGGSSGGGGTTSSGGKVTRAKIDELETKKRRVLAALVRLRAARVFNAYVRLWAVAQLTRLYADHGFFPTSSSSSGSSASSYDHHHHGDADGDWSSSSSSSFSSSAFSSLSTSTSTRWVCIQMAFCAASLIAPWRTRVIVAGAFYSRIVDVFFKLAVPGGVRSHDVAAVLFDGAVTVCVAGHVTGVIATWPRVVDAVGRSIRAQLAWLHLLRGEARPSHSRSPHPTNHSCTSLPS